MQTTSTQLVIDRVAFAYGPRTILDNVTFTVASGDRVGIVGPNGSGKTTLLRLLAGELDAGTGSITTLPAEAHVAHLHQRIDDADGETVAAHLERRAGVRSIAEAFDRAVEAVAADEPGSAELYDRALAKWLAADPSGFAARCDAALVDVGLADVRTDDRLDALSGGQRAKVQLATIQLANADVLLLDEPTNDLDHAGLELLEQSILGRVEPMVLVSHDRAFLERVVTAVVELDPHSGSTTRFNGGYAAWVEEREVARRHEYDAWHEYQSKRADLVGRAQTQRQWSERGVRAAKRDTSEPDRNVKAWRRETSQKLAAKAKQTERALDRLDANEAVDAPWEPWELRLKFAAADRSGSDAAVLHGAVVERGDFRLGPIDVVLGAGERVLVTGANGSGKSTLLGALLGDLELESGQSRLGPSVRVGRLDQARTLFPADAPLIESFGEAAGVLTTEARSQLAKLGLDAERIARPAGGLSPGEMTRATLGLFALLGSNLLVLDEPTNHLDLPAIEQLEAALAVFPHTVLLVTHDRRLAENVETDRRWHLDAGQLSEA